MGWMGYPLDHSSGGPSWANPVYRQIYIRGHIHKGLSYISKAIVWTRAPAPGIAVKTVLLLVNAGEIDAGRELRLVPGDGSPERAARTLPGSHQQ